MTEYGLTPGGSTEADSFWTILLASFTRVHRILLHHSMSSLRHKADAAPDQPAGEGAPNRRHTARRAVDD